MHKPRTLIPPITSTETDKVFFKPSRRNSFHTHSSKINPDATPARLLACPFPSPYRIFFNKNPGPIVVIKRDGKYHKPENTTPEGVAGNELIKTALCLTMDNPRLAGEFLKFTIYAAEANGRKVEIIHDRILIHPAGSIPEATV